MAEAMQLVRIANRFDFDAKLNAGKTLVGEQAKEISDPYQRGLPFFFTRFLSPFLQNGLVETRFA